MIIRGMIVSVLQCLSPRTSSVVKARQEILGGISYFFTHITHFAVGLSCPPSLTTRFLGHVHSTRSYSIDNKTRMTPPVLRFKRLTENAFAPVKGSPEAAGFDLIRYVKMSDDHVYLMFYSHNVTVLMITQSRRKERSLSRRIYK